MCLRFISWCRGGSLVGCGGEITVYFPTGLSLKNFSENPFDEHNFHGLNKNIMYYEGSWLENGKEVTSKAVDIVSRHQIVKYVHIYK